jgi:glycosyltransferase involved in cell wall biosynthesis
MLVGYTQSRSKGVSGYPFDLKRNHQSAIQEYGLRAMDGIGAKLGIQYCLMPPNFLLKSHHAVRAADIVHVHNTHGGFLNLRAVSALSSIKPVVWTLHDEWSYTGHCASTLGCERWRNGCGECPHLTTYPGISLDTTRMLARIKARSYEKGWFSVTAPSEWLVHRARESILKSREVRHVPNGVDTAIFHPRNRAAVREVLGLPQDKKIVMFAANAATIDPLKGYDYLLKAFMHSCLSIHNDLMLLGVGGTGGDIPGQFEVRWEGRIDNSRIMAAYYAAADLFVLPSLAENSPLTVLEAMACGVPVVAFDVGGVPELVIHKKTGYLARYRDISDLAEGIGYILELVPEEYNEISGACYRVIQNGHTLSQVGADYLALYGEVIAEYKKTKANK